MVSLDEVKKVAIEFLEVFSEEIPTLADMINKSTNLDGVLEVLAESGFDSVDEAAYAILSTVVKE